MAWTAATVQNIQTEEILKRGRHIKNSQAIKLGRESSDLEYTEKHRRRDRWREYNPRTDVTDRPIPSRQDRQDLAFV